jgi:hypothetical protein
MHGKEENGGLKGRNSYRTTPSNMLVNMSPNLAPCTFYWQIRVPFPDGIIKIRKKEKKKEKNRCLNGDCLFFCNLSPFFSPVGLVEFGQNSNKN